MTAFFFQLHTAFAQSAVLSLSLLNTRKEKSVDATGGFVAACDTFVFRQQEMSIQQQLKVMNMHIDTCSRTRTFATKQTWRMELGGLV